MPTFFKRFGPKGGTLLSGILIVFSFPHWDAAALIWFALVPWLLVLRKTQTSREAILQGFWLGILMTLGGLYWVAYAIHQYGNLPWAVSIFGLILFSTFNQLQFAAFAPLYRKIIALDSSKGMKILSLFTCAFAYVAIDTLIPKLFRDQLGHSTYVLENIRQLAAIGGASMITFLIVLHNESLVRLFLTVFVNKEVKTKKNKLRSQAVLAYLPSLCLCLLSLLYGVLKNQEFEELQSQWKQKRVVSVSVIQGNIGDFEKVAAEMGSKGAADNILNTFFRMSSQAIQKYQPDFVVWPETTYPSTFRTPWNTAALRLDQKLESFVREKHLTLLFGGYDHQNKKDFNSLFILYPTPQKHLPHESDLEIYHKHVLLPFGEYIPGFADSELFKKWFPQMGFFGRGPGAQVYEVPIQNRFNIRVSPMICYEALFPDYSIAAARKKSQLLLNVTNDSWFGKWGEPYLHLALTTFRSIETRLPQIRSTNTGITSYITPTGAMPNNSEIGQAQTLHYTVPVGDPPSTLMVLWGDWFGPFSIFVFLFLFIFLWKRLKFRQF